MSTSKPIEQTSSVNNVEVPKNNFLISEQTPEVVMTLDKPVDSPFDCEGCGS
jgi:transcription initiation factor IIE alpha subunit